MPEFRVDIMESNRNSLEDHVEEVVDLYQGAFIKLPVRPRIGEILELDGISFYVKFVFHRPEHPPIIRITKKAVNLNGTFADFHDEKGKSVDP